MSHKSKTNCFIKNIERLFLFLLFTCGCALIAASSRSVRCVLELVVIDILILLSLLSWRIKKRINIFISTLVETHYIYAQNSCKIIYQTSRSAISLTEIRMPSVSKNCSDNTLEVMLAKPLLPRLLLG